MKLTSTRVCGLCTAVLLLAAGLAPALAVAGEADTVTPAGLPAVGKWLLRADGSPANWLGQPDNGKELREPINVGGGGPDADGDGESAAAVCG